MNPKRTVIAAKAGVAAEGECRRIAGRGRAMMQPDRDYPRFTG